MSRRFSPLAWLAALAVLALSMMAAPARSEPATASTPRNCFGTRNIAILRRHASAGDALNPHVINVPAADVAADEIAAAEARDRRWVERCSPVIRQDRFGMPRYSYSAPGCEFGRLD